MGQPKSRGHMNAREPLLVSGPEGARGAPVSRFSYFQTGLEYGLFFFFFFCLWYDTYLLFFKNYKPRDAGFSYGFIFLLKREFFKSEHMSYILLFRVQHLSDSVHTDRGGIYNLVKIFASR